MPGLHPLSISEPQQLDTHATRVEGSNLAATGKWDTYPTTTMEQWDIVLAMPMNAKSFTIEKSELVYVCIANSRPECQIPRLKAPHRQKPHQRRANHPLPYS